MDKKVLLSKRRNETHLNLGWSMGNNQSAQLKVDCSVMVSLIIGFGEENVRPAYASDTIVSY